MLRIIMACDKNHVDLPSIEEYLRHNLYPDGVVEKETKQIFGGHARNSVLWMADLCITGKDL